MQVKWGICSAAKVSNDFCVALTTLPAEEHKIQGRVYFKNTSESLPSLSLVSNPTKLLVLENLSLLRSLPRNSMFQTFMRVMMA